MAARDGRFGGSRMLPEIKPKHYQVKKTRKEMRYRAFSKPLTLPSLDIVYADIEKVSTLFTKKQLCKKVSEWFSNWRPWQQRILLCSMTEKCSKSQLRALVTSLEPVFHRDYVSKLGGMYPTRLLQPRFVHTMSSMVANKEFSRYRGLNPIQTASTAARKEAHFTSHESKDSEGMKKSETLEKLLEESEHQDELDYEACYHDVAVEEGVQYDHYSEESDLPFASLAITPATEVGVFPSRRHEHAPPFLRKVSTRNFFPDDKLGTVAKLGAMRSIRRAGDQNRIYGGDPITFKSTKWWQGHKGPKLLKARRSRLSKYFKMQLNQINQWLDDWLVHERVDMLAEVVKCCDADCLNFFALCLNRRLRDQTGIDSLPDHILHKIFCYLDVRSLCRSSQVCHRWRYLCQDSNIWKKRLRMIGTNEGISNLPRKIESLAKNQHVDWKQAYMEVRDFYQKESTTLSEQQEPSKVEEDDNTEPMNSLLMFSGEPAQQAFQRLQETPEKKAQSPSGFDLVEIVVVKTMEDVGPAQTPTTADRITRKAEFETKVEDQNDLTGGNLKMLAKSLRLLLKQKDEPEEEAALDIRPALIQASNLLDRSHDHTKFRYLSLAVQGVLAIKKVTRLQGHMDGVYCLQFDTRRVMTGSLDRTLRIWDVRSGKSIHKVKGHKGGIRCLQFDDDKIVTGSWDMTIMVWHIVYFNRLHVLYGHRGCVSCLQFNDFLLVSGSHDKTIRIWDTSSWECIRVIEAHEATVTCLEFDGKRILSGSVDRTLKLWDVNTGEMIRIFIGHEEPVASLKVLGKLVMSGSTDGMIMFWDLENGHCEAAIQAHEGPVHSISVCGDHFISSGGDNLIKEWDMCTCTCLRTLQGHRGPVQCVRGTPNRILSCSSDGTVRIWDLDRRRSQSDPRNIALHENTIEAKVVRADKSTCRDVNDADL